MSLVFSVLLLLLLVGCTVSSSKDADPLLDLLLEHTDNAATMIFDFTSQAPSMEPTAEPSAEPTAEPTVLLPTLVPSALPSSPTLVPSPAPSNPTAKPTRVPTAKPTRVPTIQPTANPTPQPGDPTLAPTVAPTTARPTASPSAAPTKQNSPLLTFNNTITIGGVLEPTLDANSRLAVIAATAESMDITSNTVSYVTDTSTVETTRRLAKRDGQSNGRLRMISLFSTTYSVHAVTQVNIPLSATAFTNATALYQSLTTLLEDAVASGAFTSTLRNASMVYNATAVADAAVTQVAVGPPVITDYLEPAPPGPEDDDELGAGEIAGVVIGCFVFVALIVAGVYYVLFVRRKEFEAREVFAHNSEVEISL